MNNPTIILSLPFLEVRLDEQTQLIEAKWLDKKTDITDNELKHHLDVFADLFKKYPVKGFLVDSRQFHLVMNLKIQAWHDEHIVPRYIDAGIEKIAFIMTTEFVTGLSIEQAFDEPVAQQLNVNFFDNEVDARAWIKNTRLRP